MTSPLPWWPIALTELGVAETPGAAHSSRVLEYLRSTTLGAELASQDETPWCSAFVNWCMEKAGVKGTDSAWARSWLEWGREWGTGLMTATLDGRAVVPPPGAVCVFQRGKGGHVGFFDGVRVVWSDPVGQNTALSPIVTVDLLGGNQGDRVKVSSYPASRLLGIRVPA